MVSEELFNIIFFSTSYSYNSNPENDLFWVHAQSGCYKGIVSTMFWNKIIDNIVTNV